ncbi:ornithine carbamoyltransferase [Micromonospora sp. AMSO12t]|uniref:ornithine carbamoyltransferase n=1 Tax=Micromonospora sp. AMSO12t TaxID=2650410 RepID=UPI00124B83EC|nr:ornithine carbamoyltransferase [Micromonospora sp. AMSO12t]KAB1162086.1 ornithine carbamoyltransferase [Micromonospora sp. AMSO12t]
MTDIAANPRLTNVPAPQGRRAHGLFSLDDLSDDTYHRLVRRSYELFSDPSDHRSPLSGAIVGTLFTKTSTRTRTAFTTAVLRLGGHVISYGPNDLQLATGESVADTGRVLGGMLDGLVARTAGPMAQLRELSRVGTLGVVNAMAVEEHPTQAICDVATLALLAGPGRRLDGLRLLYVGEGNNTATALALALARLPGSRTTFATPAGYGLPPGYLEAARRRGWTTGARVEEVHDLADVTGDFDVVYTTRWQTTGTAKQDPHWREAFRPFHVDAALLRRWPSSVFMHDLPAHRGEEVESSVLDGPRSIAWTQARMKLSSAMAVMEWLFSSGDVLGETAE